MIETNEPKDGDFIAYIEQLQKESAARLLGSHYSLNTDKAAAAGAGAGKADSHFFAARGQAESRVARPSNVAHMLSARSAAGRLLTALLTIVVGVALTFYWLVASTSLLLLAVGIALVFWGVRQIRRVAQTLTPRAQQAQTQFSKTFGASARKAK